MDKLESILGFSQNEITSWIVKTGASLLAAIAILIVGFWLAKRASKLITKGMQKSSMDAGLTSFLSSVASTTLKILIVLVAAGQVGIEMTSFLTLIGAAGLAIGMAFSGALSNLAGGVMILFFKPFKVGDVIEAQNQNGKVKEMHIFNTIILTGDNKTVLLPNGALANGTITNYTREGIRRIDMVINFSYGGDYDKVKHIIEENIAKDKRVLKEPAPFVGLGGLNNGGVSVTVRPWCATVDYWGVNFDLHEKVYKEFSANNISFPG